MSGDATLRHQVREELVHIAGPVLTISCEADLQALTTLIRAIGSNTLLASKLGCGIGAMQIQVMPGDFEGCGCHEKPLAINGSVSAKPSRSNMKPALGGIVTLARVQAANLPIGSEILLDQEAVITPQARDWFRQNKIQVQRSET